MKKQLKLVMAIAAIAVAGGIGIYASQSESQVSDVALANIEALADNEGSGSCKWKRTKDSHGCIYWECLSNGTGDPCVCGSIDG